MVEGEIKYSITGCNIFSDMFFSDPIGKAMAVLSSPESELE